MDLQEQRITCLRMAIDMGCKPDAVIATATELMSFVTGGAASQAATVAEPQAPVADAIAACGTALPASETAGLVLAQSKSEAPAEAPAAADQAVETEAVATEPGPGPAEAAPVEASPEPAPVATAPVEASEPVAATPAAAVDDPPPPGIAEAAEAAQVPAAEQGAAPAEDAPAAVAKDLPTPPPTLSNGAATGDATSAAATAS